jgi:DNA polymerase-3 subunit gamma/tau
VFPRVGRLFEAGANLEEFVGGAGDVLRAVLLAGLGGRAEGLTEGLQAVVQRHAPQLPPADVVRLLAALAEAEPQIRQSGNPRLAVEVLLLRWAMMDRTVELESVLRALDAGAGPRGDPGSGSGRARPAAPTTPPAPPPAPSKPSAPPTGGSSALLRDAVPAPPVAVAPVPETSAVERGPIALERLRALWPRIAGGARTTSPMLGTLLAGSQVAAVDGAVVTLQAGDAAHLEGLTHKQDAIAALLGPWVDGAVRVRIGAPGPAQEAPSRAPRLTPRTADAERLKVLRQKDPTLSAAVDALDLELIE